MADEEIRINGKALQELRVVDLKKECDKNKLSKNGSKKELIERLKAHLQFERLQQEENTDEVPNQKLQNSGEMGKSDFIKQYLQKQRELLVEQKKRFSEDDSQESGNSQDESENSPKKKSPQKVAGDFSEPESPTKKTVTKIEKISEKVEKPPVIEESSPPPARSSRRLRNSGSENSDEGSPAKRLRSQSGEKRQSIEKIPEESEVTKEKEKICEETDVIKDDKQETVSPPKSERKALEEVSTDNSKPESEEKKQNVTAEPMEVSTPKEDLSKGKTSDDSENTYKPTETAKVTESVSISQDDKPKAFADKEKKDVIEKRSRSHSSSSESSSSSSSSSSGRSRSRSPEVSKEKSNQERVVTKKLSKGRSSSSDTDTSERTRSKKKTEKKNGQRSSSRSSSASSRSSSGKSKSPARKMEKERSRSRSSSPVGEDNISRGGKVKEELNQSVTRKEKSETSEMPMEVDVKKEITSQSEEEESQQARKEVNTSSPKVTRRISLTGREKDEIEVKQEEDIREKPEEVEKEKPVRKRKWGSTKSTSSTSTAPKRLSNINISTDSLKELMPDIKDIRPVEAVLDFGEEEEKVFDNESDVRDVTIRRTIVVKDEEEGKEEGEHSEGEVDDGEDSDKEDGEKSGESADEPEDKESEMDEGENKENKENLRKVETKEKSKEEVKATVVNKKSDPIIVRRISAQQPVIETEEPTAARRTPSPPRRPKSKYVHVRNLVRPFTLGQLKELLKRTGKLVEEDFWIDKIKSHCIASYESVEDAEATRNALHGSKWPSSNPKILVVDFSDEDQLEFFKNKDSQPSKQQQIAQAQKERKEKEEEMKKQREARREARQKEIEERKMKEQEKKSPPIREWDRHKIRQSQEPEDLRPAGRGRSRSVSPGRREKRRERSRDRDGRDRERDARRGDRRGDRRVEDEPPAKLLDDLFKKTKALPCIYWLPNTEEQVIEREKLRKEREIQKQKREKEIEERRAKMLEERRRSPPRRSDEGPGGRSRGERRNGRSRSGSRSRRRR